MWFGVRFRAPAFKGVYDRSPVLFFLIFFFVLALALIKSVLGDILQSLGAFHSGSIMNQYFSVQNICL